MRSGELLHKFNGSLELVRGLERSDPLIRLSKLTGTIFRTSLIALTTLATLCVADYIERAYLRTEKTTATEHSMSSTPFMKTLFSN